YRTGPGNAALLHSPAGDHERGPPDRSGSAAVGPGCAGQRGAELHGRRDRGARSDQSQWRHAGGDHDGHRGRWSGHLLLAQRRQERHRLHAVGHGQQPLGGNERPVRRHAGGGDYGLTARATGLSAGTSSDFSVSPGPATHLAFAVQPGTTTAGHQIAPAVKVAAQDALGNAVPTFTGPVTVALGSNPSGGTLSGSTTVSAVSGVATLGDLSINISGTGYTLTATATGLAGATSTPFGITPGLATHLV